MNFDVDWLLKFFTYSSIQVKFISSFIAILVFIVVRRVLVGIISNKIEDSFMRYRWQKTITYVVFFFAVITIGRVWFKGVESIATYFGLLSAGIAIALRDPITNITGWMFILWRSPFTVGDRIEIGENAGDVIDVNFFKFTIMEIGKWIDGESSTGRIIHVPNGKVFTENLANYGKGFKYIWNELPILVTFESDWKKAKEILHGLSTQHTSQVSKAAAKKFQEVSKLFMMHQPNFKPKVYTKIEDSGILLTVRYLCNPRKRRASSQAIWEGALEAFSTEDNIKFAYPTIRYYNEKNEMINKPS